MHTTPRPYDIRTSPDRVTRYHRTTGRSAGNCEPGNRVGLSRVEACLSPSGVPFGRVARRRRVLRLNRRGPDAPRDAGILPAATGSLGHGIGLFEAALRAALWRQARRHPAGSRPASMDQRSAGILAGLPLPPHQAWMRTPSVERCLSSSPSVLFALLFALPPRPVCAPARAQRPALKQAGMDAGAAIAPPRATGARRMRAGVAQPRRPGGPPKTSQFQRPSVSVAAGRMPAPSGAPDLPCVSRRTRRRRATRPKQAGMDAAAVRRPPPARRSAACPPRS
jgi:hypothetical protein